DEPRPPESDAGRPRRLLRAARDEGRRAPRVRRVRRARLAASDGRHRSEQRARLPRRAGPAIAPTRNRRDDERRRLGRFRRKPRPLIVATRYISLSITATPVSGARSGVRCAATANVRPVTSMLVLKAPPAVFAIKSRPSSACALTSAVMGAP